MSNITQKYLIKYMHLIKVVKISIGMCCYDIKYLEVITATFNNEGLIFEFHPSQGC